MLLVKMLKQPIGINSVRVYHYISSLVDPIYGYTDRVSFIIAKR